MPPKKGFRGSMVTTHIGGEKKRGALQNKKGGERCRRFRGVLVKRAIGRGKELQVRVGGGGDWFSINKRKKEGKPSSRAKKKKKRNGRLVAAKEGKRKKNDVISG